jgi:hypothetical protein
MKIIEENLNYVYYVQPKIINDNANFSRMSFRKFLIFTHFKSFQLIDYYGVNKQWLDFYNDGLMSAMVVL